MLPHEVGGGTSEKGSWNLEKILARINLKIHKQLIRQEQSPIALISWIFYSIKQHDQRPGQPGDFQTQRAA